jgi:replication factor C subunit 3/5
MLFVHKYIPKKENEFVFNKNTISLLKTFSKNSEIKNTIVYGNYGSGKKCIANYLINSNFNMNSMCYKTKEVNYAFNDMELHINKSQYHYEIDANDNNFNDKKITLNFIHEIVKTTDVFNNSYKIIIVKNAENLSNDAQIVITTLLELYEESCRIIFICHNLSKMLLQLKSRCLLLKIEMPSDIEIKNTINHIIDKEELKISDKNIDLIITKSKNNINIAIFLLQRFSVGNETLNNNVDVFIEKCCSDIFKYNANPDIIRENIFTILVYDINIHLLLKKIIENIYEKKYPSDMRYKITQAISYYHSNSIKGYRQIYHYEAMIFYIINVLKKINTKLLIEDI